MVATHQKNKVKRAQEGAAKGMELDSDEIVKTRKL